MTLPLFAVLAASCAVAILDLVDLAIPFGPLRRWLLAGPHVETTDPVHGPWYVVRDGERDVGHPSPSAAAGHLSGPERVRAWAADLTSCPWCVGAWVTAVALAAASTHYGASLLWYWPALWWCSAVSVVVTRRVAEG